MCWKISRLFHNSVRRSRRFGAPIGSKHQGGRSPQGPPGRGGALPPVPSAPAQHPLTHQEQRVSGRDPSFHGGSLRRAASRSRGWRGAVRQITQAAVAGRPRVRVGPASSDMAAHPAGSAGKLPRRDSPWRTDGGPRQKIAGIRRSLPLSKGLEREGLKREITARIA